MVSSLHRETCEARARKSFVHQFQVHLHCTSHFRSYIFAGCITHQDAPHIVHLLSLILQQRLSSSAQPCMGRQQASHHNPAGLHSMRAAMACGQPHCRKAHPSTHGLACVAPTCTARTHPTPCRPACRTCRQQETEQQWRQQNAGPSGVFVDAVTGAHMAARGAQLLDKRKLTWQPAYGWT